MRAKTTNSESGKLEREMIHLNGNTLCAIDTETTGLDPHRHEIVQLSVVPLDYDLKPMKGISPFNMTIRPLKPHTIDYDAMKVNRAEFAKLATTAPHPDVVENLFTDWVENRLMLPPNKRIVPLGKNWRFDSDFIKEWLQPTLYNHLFNDAQARDLQFITLFYNDIAFARCEKFPFPKNNLGYIANQLNVEWTHARAHDSLYDAYTTAECYRRIVLSSVADLKVKETGPAVIDCNDTMEIQEISTGKISIWPRSVAPPQGWGELPTSNGARLCTPESLTTDSTPTIGV